MSTHQQSDSIDAIRGSFPLKPLVACMRVAITGGLLVGGSISARAHDLPIQADKGWITSGVAKVDLDKTTANHLAIHQKSNKAIYNWQEFNVGKDKSVDFNQDGGASSVALNRIFQDSPSRIMGQITSNGQVILLNRNGVVFEKGSSVDTRGLIASSLNISDDTFNRGIIREFEKDSGPGQAALDGQTGDASTAVNPDSSIKVEAGAKIHVGQNGQVILAAPKVSNAGSITADEKGQIIMVASEDKVYLQPASSDSPFAGLLVEVGSGGKVENLAGGDIAVRQGNVTMAGFAVNQSGRISATTSVNVNGSIRLLAREKAADDVFVGTHHLKATKTDRANGTQSKVTFGAGSSTEIQADNDGATAYDEQTQRMSYVEASGRNISMESGATIVAPHGQVNMTATNNLDQPLLGTAGVIHIDNGATIDVSGVKNVKVAMERNVAEVAVQTYNLRDAPYQKGGVLQGAKVKVDIRKDTKILDASGGAAIKRGIEERLSEGGKINLVSSGSVTVNSGAKLDISGGSLNYQDGYINTTKLVDKDGHIVDISDAKPEEKYVAIYGATVEKHSKWAQNKTWNMLGGAQGAGRFEKGYTEGKAGGSVNIQSPVTAWGGKLVAGSERGLYQRDNPASGGTFSINVLDNVGTRANVFLSGQNLVFQHDNPTVNLTLDQAVHGVAVGNGDLILSTEAIKDSGISQLVVKTGGNANIDGNVAVEMPALGKVSIDATQIDVAGSVYAAGGSINLNSIHDLNLHNGAELDVSGRWINDYQANAAGTAGDTLVINGGSVNVNARENLNFERNATIKADGGAWLDSSGRKLLAGDGGSIKLAAGMSGVNGVAKVEGKLSAYALGKGGKLTLASSKVNVGADVAESDALNLKVHDGVFDIASQLGFSELNLAANKMVVKGNTDLALTTQNRVLDNDFQTKESGKSIADFSKVTTLAENLRKPLKFSLLGLGEVDIETGSHITVDKGSTIDIQASDVGKGIFIDGTLEARGGAINALLRADQAVEYNPGQSIWLGSNARLSVQGTTRLNPVDTRGYTTGDVLAGGTVSLEARRGYVVVEKDSQIDVSGAKAELNVPSSTSTATLPTFPLQTIGSDAGKVSVKAAEGIVVDGNLSAQGGTSSNRNGRLDVALSRQFRNEPAEVVFPDQGLAINVVQQAQNNLPNGMHFGSAIAPSLLGQATVASETVKQSGFDDLRLAVAPQFDPVSGAPLTPGEIRFVGDVNLGLANSIVLDAQTLAWKPAAGQSTGNVKLDTAYLQLGSSAFSDVAGNPVKGGGSLEANTQWTQLNGAAMLTGFNNAKLNSAHDLRLVGVRLGGQRAFTGELKTAADLDLRASQIYPSSLSDYKITVTDPNGKIAISSSGNTDQTPLSAAGHLSLNAAEIQQDGVVKAPLGTIDFKAGKRISFGADSVTSVSADGKTIPLGTIASNLWKYSLGNDGNLVFNEGATSLTLGEKHLNVTAPDVAFNKGGVVDVSGGGELMAAEFQPGLGGSYDYLAPGSNSYRGGFAILPSLGSTLAPFDHNMSAGFNYMPGSSIYLSGGNGLPAGQYTVLPAQYALLPGAYLVTPVAKNNDQLQTSYTGVGLPVMSGYLAQATGAQDARKSGFLVESHDQVLKRSQYDIQTASKFFANRAKDKNVSTPMLPVDAGQVSIAASTKLLLEGLFKVDAPNGRGAKMDIAAQQIKVVDSLDTNAAPGVLEILADNLSNLHVDSLLLGGTRSFNNQTGSTDLTVTADDVTIAKNAKLSTLDFLAAAKKDLTVEQGASIASSGTVNTGDNTINIAGDGALLRVSADKQVTLNRSDSLGASGNLTVQQGAQLKASKSMLLDSSRSSALNGDIVMNGGALSLTANTINIGEVGAVQGNALNLSNDKLLSLTVDDLVLNSRGAINFYGDVGKANASGGFDAITFNHLVLDAAALSGFDNSGKSAQLQANSIELSNSHHANVATQGTGSGNLQLSAKQLSEGNGTLAVNGFSQVGLTAAAATDQKEASQYTVKGDGELDVKANLTLTADAVTANDGHHLKINAADGGGYNVDVLGAGKSSRTVSAGLGGGIEVDAKQIRIQDGSVLLPSGDLKLTAETGDVAIQGQSTVDLAGRAMNFADKVAYSQGGVFDVEAKQGNVTVSHDASVDVSSGGGKAKGGELLLKAQAGSVDLAGSIKANHGSASIDMSSYANGSNFDAMINKLGQAGVSDNLYFRVRDADIVQTAGHDLHANHVDLVADSGNVDVAGKIVVDGAKQGGSVGLYAGGKVLLRDGSLISAKGGATGGDVLLSSLAETDSAKGGIAVEAGSKIDVSGADAASGGNVVFSALRTQDGVNVQPVAGQVVGYKHFYAEGVQKYTNTDLGNGGAIDQAGINKMMGEASAYMTAASQNVAALGGGIQLRPGIEVDYSGDLALATAWDLGAARYGQDNVPGTVTIRSTSNLNINNSLTDGFSGGALQSGESWSMQLVAGADTHSADRLATSTSGNLTIGHNASVHTGSGDIKAVAGGDIVFTDQTSTIYNAGRTDPTNPKGTLDGIQPAESMNILAGEYPMAGGDLTLRAGHAIKGAVSDQFLLPWMYRQGSFDPTLQAIGLPPGDLTAWSVDPGQFQQNVGSFGGGKVSISAAGNIDDLSVMLPTTGKQMSTTFADNSVIVGGGGQLDMKAGGDISGGAVLLGKGEGEIVAGGQVKGSQSLSQLAFTSGPQILMGGDPSNSVTGSGHLTVAGNKGVTIAGVTDPMLISNAYTTGNSANSHFFSYTAGDALALQSLSGDVRLNADLSRIAQLTGINSAEEQSLLRVYPASLNVTAFSGSIKLDKDIVMFPSASAALNLFAKQNIGSTDGVMHTVLMSDVDPAKMPRATKPLDNIDNQRLSPLANLFSAQLLNAADKSVRQDMHSIVPVHLGDTEPARIVTQQGDISSVLLNLPKRAIIQAGRDLLNTPMQIQHVNSDDTSLIAAGRDLRFTASLDQNGNIDSSDTRIKMEVAGPGRVLVKTGRNMDLGASVGLSSVGNLYNSNLAAGGASLDLLIGLQEGRPDYAAFIAKYLTDATKYPEERGAVIQLAKDLTGVSDSNNALIAFAKLTANEILPVEPKLNALLSQVFFNELKVSGSAAAANKLVGNQAAYDAIDTLFPDHKWSGDLSLFYSKIQTIVGGDINLMVPGGTVNAGLSVAPSGAGAKKADQLGIVAQGPGHINAYVKDNFIVNTSRTFTLGGGDILIWASEGDIDAGKGAKSALSVVLDPAYFDANDQLVVPAPKITSGSGIRTAAAVGATPGNVYLFAPKGKIDAGEAGIACNQCVFGAKSVANVANIDIGKGGGIGVPSTSPNSVAAGFTGTSNVTASVSQMAESSVGDETSKNAKSLAKTLLGVLSLDFLGFGD